jgi:4-hydroxy-tetrahydrodipicolinate reductase
MKPKLLIVGAAGRMGKRILALAKDGDALEIVAAVEKQAHADIGKDAGLAAGTEEIGIRLASTYAAGADVAVDFSLPQVADKTLEYCAENKTALVLGTTGLGAKQKAKIKDVSATIPVIYGTNMSVGMNVLFALAGKVALTLGQDYDIEIVEQHHRFKKDAPSGSALTLAENICRETSRDFPSCLVRGRSGKDTPRVKGQIGVHAVRAGDITGGHSVLFSTLGETVTLGHTAHNRDTFARGALRAAIWLVGKKPGLYSMADVLGIS